MDVYNPKAIADRIKAARKSKNVTQEQMAELINISYSTYTKIENFNQNITMETFIKIADTLNISTDYLIYGNYERLESTLENQELASLLIKNITLEEINQMQSLLDSLSRIKRNSLSNQ